MRRPVFLITICYMLGILCAYFFTVTDRIIICNLGTLCVLGIIAAYKKNKKVLIVVLCLTMLLLGCTNFKLKNEYRGDFIAFLDKEIYVIGDVVKASLKEGITLTIETKTVVLEGKRHRVQGRMIVKLQEESILEKNIVGKRVGIDGVLQAPPQKRNPKMFNYEMYLKSKGIYGVLYGKNKGIQVIQEGDIAYIFRVANRIKNRVTQVVWRILPEKEGGVLLAILLGDKDVLDIDIYQTFKDIGVAHILAVSGLHVGIVYLFVNRLLGRCSSKIKIPVLLAVLCFYVIITGCSHSILRAASMTGILIVAPMMNRRYDALSALCIVALVFLVINPISLMDVGFQLSFASVLSIIALYQPILTRLRRLPEFWGQVLAISTAAQVGLIPVIAYHFNYIALSAFIVNIPIVILVGYVVPLGLVTIIIGFVHLHTATILGGIIFYLMKIMVSLSNFVKSMPFANMSVISPSWFLILCYYSFLSIFIMDEEKIKSCRCNRNRLLMLIIALYMVGIGAIHFMPSKMKITFVDVGQGDCILIQTPRGKNILIDGGGSDPKTNAKVDVGKEVLVPFLLKNRVRKIDMILISHYHTDHIGGLLHVLKNIKVSSLMVGMDDEKNEILQNLKAQCFVKKIKIYKGEKDDIINVEKHLSMKILHPTKFAMNTDEDEVNNQSLVILLTYKGKKILFTGDIEGETEKKLIENYPQLKVDVLKVAHHGSVTSSTESFIATIDPKIAIIQVGKNHFGHPHQKVLDRFVENNIILFRNDKNGAVTLKIDGKSMQVKTMIKVYSQ
ncbi:DNA internalization-related competence protein ComEC/Rec2 [Clostridiaceae bacterium 35-E11]